MNKCNVDNDPNNEIDINELFLSHLNTVKKVEAEKANRLNEARKEQERVQDEIRKSSERFKNIWQ